MLWSDLFVRDLLSLVIRKYLRLYDKGPSTNLQITSFNPIEKDLLNGGSEKPVRSMIDMEFFISTHNVAKYGTCIFYLASSCL